jgi:hypothetical protein
MRIDHVVHAVRDLDEAGARFEHEHGLRTSPGGIHPRWGTANRIAPLGADYVELIAVVDEEAARASALGRALLELTAGGDRWFAVCLADDDIDATAARLGLTVEPGSRTLPDGRVVAWRGAGIEDPRRSPEQPFFIAWDVPRELHPGADPPAHPSGAGAIAWVEVVGDAPALAAWTNDPTLPLRCVPGEPRGVAAVALATPRGDLVIR